MRRHRVFIAAFLSCTTSADEQASAQADALFKRGKALVREGKLEDAYRAYRASYALKKGFDIAGNLGNVELELGMARDAAEHLSYCVRNFPATGAGWQLSFTQKRLAEARAQVAALSIRVNVDGAEVLVDGRSMGRSPLEEEVFVDPGARRIEAKMASHAMARETLMAEQGGRHEVTLNLLPAASTPPLVLISTPPPKRSGKHVAPIVAGIATAVTGLSLGIASTVAANDLAASLEAQRTALDPYDQKNACLSPANAASCAALDHDYRARSTLGALSVVGFVTAGAASVATITYWLWPSGGGRQVGLRAGPLPGGASFGLSGRF